MCSFVLCVPSNSAFYAELQVLSVCYESELTNCASIEDVVFGDVFLCSGQSNMAYGMSSALGELDDWRNLLRHGAVQADPLDSLSDASNQPWVHKEVSGIRLVTVAREIGGENDPTSALNVSFTTKYVRRVSMLVHLT